MEPLSISMPLAREVPRSFGGMAGTLFISLLFALLLFCREEKEEGRRRRMRERRGGEAGLGRGLSLNSNYLVSIYLRG